MKKLISSLNLYKDDIQDINELCGVCNSKADTKEELLNWITCESCKQGYHGKHILEEGKDGFCPMCYGPLLVNLDLYLYKITGIVSGRLQFQAKKSTKKPSLGKLFLSVFPFVFLFVGLGMLASFPISS